MLAGRADTYFASLTKGYDEASITYDLHQIALSDRSGKLYRPGTDVDRSGNVTHAQIKPERLEDVEVLISIETVPTRRLDDVLSRCSLGDLTQLVKQGVDGSEEKIVGSGD